MIIIKILFNLDFINLLSNSEFLRIFSQFTTFVMLLLKGRFKPTIKIIFAHDHYLVKPVQRKF